MRLSAGIVNRVVEPDELMSVTWALARRIADGPPIAIRLAKRAIYRNQEADLRAALEFETFAQNACFETEDAREGIRAFVEKRAPVFRGHRAGTGPAARGGAHRPAELVSLISFLGLRRAPE